MVCWVVLAGKYVCFGFMLMVLAGRWGLIFFVGSLGNFGLLSYCLLDDFLWQMMMVLYSWFPGFD